MNFNATLIGQMIAFSIFVYLVMKYVWPPLLSAMQERTAKIEEGLSAASRAADDLEKAQAEVAEQLSEAKATAAGIVDSANKRASQIVDEAKDQARTESDKIKTAAEAELEQESNRLREQLRAQVSVLAVAGAEKILRASVDSSTHQGMLDELANEL